MYLSRYQAINDAEKLAIAEAQTAKQQGDVKALTAKLDYLQQLRKAKADAMQKAQDMAWEREKFRQQMALDYYKANKSGSGSTKTNKENDIASAILDFKNRMQTHGWAGANPAAYQYYADQLKQLYGAIS